MRNSFHHSGPAQTLPAAQEQVANGGSLVGSSRDLAPGARADELVSYDDGEGSTIREGTRQRRQSEKEKAINSLFKLKIYIQKKGGRTAVICISSSSPKGAGEF